MIAPGASDVQVERSEPAAPAVEIRPSEREAVAVFARAYAEALPADRATPYLTLAESAEAGTVPAELAGVLERVCRVALESGKARELGRAEAERTLLAVFRRTPNGARVEAELDALNRALDSVTSRRLRSIRASSRLPGRYVLSLDLEGCSVSIGLGPEGLVVESLAVG